MSDGDKISGAARGAARVTAQQVADAAGVSVSAVSRAFTAGASVSRKTRQKVLATAEKLGYRPNILARSLMTRRTDLIGVLMGEFGNPFYLDFLDRFTHKLQQRGERTLLINVAHGDELSQAVQLVMQYQVDGLVATSSNISPRLVAECAKHAIPVVVFARHAKRSRIPSVSCDNVEGGRLVGRLLARRGYVRPAFIGGPAQATTTIDRNAGFAEALRDAGLTPDALEIGGGYTYKAGADAARRLLGRDPRPDAVFCADDILALGALDVARREFGLRAPSDIGVVGFDDIPMAAAAAYGLTTVRQPLDDMIDLTLELLSAGAAAPGASPLRRIVPCTLVERATVRPGP